MGFSLQHLFQGWDLGFNYARNSAQPDEVSRFAGRLGATSGTAKTSQHMPMNGSARVGTTRLNLLYVIFRVSAAFKQSV